VNDTQTKTKPSQSEAIRLASWIQSTLMSNLVTVVDVPVKVMLKLPLLTREQSERAVALSVEGGATYLKNASGGAVGVATAEQIRFLRRLAPPHIRIKASGRINTAAKVRELLEAGADLIGTSAAAQIIEEARGGNSGRLVRRSTEILNHRVKSG
jgi:deoxyribose-phosphate aldolase